MVTVHLNGRPYKCPTSWQELTTRQYVKMMKDWDPEIDIENRDFFKLFCILTGAGFKKMAKTPENEDSIWNCIHWVIDEKFSFSETKPKAIEIDGKQILIPDGPGQMSIGANIHARKVIEKSKTYEENIAAAAAIYLQPLYDESKFDPKRVPELEEKLLDMPAYLIYPVGFFLLKRALTFGKRPRNVVSLILRSLFRKPGKTLQGWLRPDDLFHTTIWD